jgi:hypothetical protein
MADEPRTTKERITDYFTSFLKNEPRGVITRGMVRSGPGWAKDAGIYEFTMGATGDTVMARYSFVYVYEGGEWKISHHHSSIMPEAMLSHTNKGEILEDHEVRSLFHLWNDALATGNPDIVANRYAKNAILLPTVSGEYPSAMPMLECFWTKFSQRLLVYDVSFSLQTNLEPPRNVLQTIFQAF